MKKKKKPTRFDIARKTRTPFLIQYFIEEFPSVPDELDEFLDKLKKFDDLDSAFA